jgi:hypothetical protein
MPSVNDSIKKILNIAKRIKRLSYSFKFKKQMKGCNIGNFKT